MEFHNRQSWTTLSTFALAFVVLAGTTVHGLPYVPYSQEHGGELSGTGPGTSSRDASSLMELLKQQQVSGHLSPDDVYLLGLALLADTRDSHRPKPAPLRASSSSTGDVFGSRPRREFNFGFAGLDNIDHIMSSLNYHRQKGRALKQDGPGPAYTTDLEKLKQLMVQAG